MIRLQLTVLLIYLSSLSPRVYAQLQSCPELQGFLSLVMNAQMQGEYTKEQVLTPFGVCHLMRRMSHLHFWNTLHQLHCRSWMERVSSG